MSETQAETLPEGVHVEPITDGDRHALKTYNVPLPRGHVCVDVVLRRVADGLEVKCIDTVGWSLKIGEEVDRALGGARFMWSEGNYACDCNRRLFFERALGLEISGDDVECSHGQYEVIAPAWLVDAIEIGKRNQQRQREMIERLATGNLRLRVTKIDQDKGEITVDVVRGPRK